MHASGLETESKARVEKGFDDAIDFLKVLVHEPSTLGCECDAQRLVHNYLLQLGLPSDMWDLDIESMRSHPLFGHLDLPYLNRPNVTCLWKAPAPCGRSLILNGHIDVVPVSSPELWTHDPWGGEIEGDWLYGRGAADMKGGLVAMLLAVQAIRSIAVELAGDVIFQSVIEEEATGNGTLACVLRGQRADTAIVPEPIQSIAAGVGIMWFRVRIFGPAQHIYATYKSSNPIDKLIPIITGLRGLEAELNAEVTHPLYCQVEHPINLNFGIIRGGDWPASTPTEVQLECRIGIEPGHAFAETEARVRSTVATVASQDPFLREHLPVVEFFGCRTEPTVGKAGGPAVTLLSNINQELGGTPLTLIPFTGNTDARFLVNQLGIEASTFGPIGERFHVRDERVSISSIKHTAQVIALFILRWCKVANERQFPGASHAG